MDDLRDAIEQVYTAFASVPKPVTIDGCPCCIDRKDVKTLLGTSLRQLTSGELSSYASSVFLTVGELADFLYFLPRILEITATELSWWPDPEVTARAIRTAKPENWTAEQRVALDKYLKTVVATAIRTEDYEQLDGWICAIATMGFDVRPYLDEIAKYPPAVLAYFESNAESLPRNKLSNPFWELPCTAHDTIVGWFFSKEVAKIPFEVYGCALKRIEVTPS